MTKIELFVEEYGTYGWQLLLADALDGSARHRQLWSETVEPELLAALAEVRARMNHAAFVAALTAPETNSNDCLKITGEIIMNG